MATPRKILLGQLPIPPVSSEPIRGNVPLAAGYLKLYAQRRGLAVGSEVGSGQSAVGSRKNTGREAAGTTERPAYDIEILPTQEANTLSDEGLVRAILGRRPWMVGFTCYLWNIQRTLWICQRLKQAAPDIKIILGGPEITSDNRWVLDHPAVDYAVIGEGEQTFSELLSAEIRGRPLPSIDGLYVRGSSEPVLFRRPLPQLNEISSPYLAGILDAADEQMLLLETIRGCVFKCKFCYYPKSYDALYFLDREKIVANLAHARERGAREVVLLDPTLNQRKDFADFLRLLAECNPGRAFTYFGELRAEGINREIAELLHAANFTEVEIGLQSIDPLAMDLMDRKNNLRAFERGARAMLDVGIKVKVDLIIGLPGDTAASIRRGMRYLRDSGLYSEVQVFNLAILPGTAFRQEAEQLGLVFQDRPPYYVLKTPTLNLAQMAELMAEAEELFETEFDPLGPPVLEFAGDDELIRCCRIDLDDAGRDIETAVGGAADRAQALTLWLHSGDFHERPFAAAGIVDRLLAENPYSTLQVVLEPSGHWDRLTVETLEAIRAACFRNPTYLDRFYSVSSRSLKAAKRTVVLLQPAWRDDVPQDWQAAVEDYATVVWEGATAADVPAPTETCALTS